MNELLAANTTAETSPELVVATQATLSIFAAQRVDETVLFEVRLRTPLLPQHVCYLTSRAPVLLGPGNYEVVRPSLATLGVAIGVVSYGGTVTMDE